MKEFEMKYGCNPNQKPSKIYMHDGTELPIEILCGRPGYINFLDAFNSWQLVKELKAALGLPAVTSFKHVSPTSAAVGIPLSETLKKACFVDDIVVTLALGLQDLQSLGLVAGSDDAVGDLTLDHESGGHVADVGESHPVAEGAHTVGSSCASVSARQGRLVKALDIVNEASLLELIGKGSSDSGGGGRNVLEGGYCGESESLFELLDKLPGVECIKEIDVAGSAAEDLDGEIASVVHIYLRGLLIGVTAVFKFEFFHFYLPFGICGEEKTF